ncbi:MAG: hypothetical protein AAF560_30885 [Acidobacteriota bacterium]
MSSLAAEPLPLEALLDALHEDPERAAELLLDLRRKLTTVFESRGFADAPELVDRTIDRATRKATEGVDLRDQPFPYLYGIARFVMLEAGRHQQREQRLHYQLSADATPPADDEETPRLECFRRCLAKLSAAHRELLWRYFDASGGRRIAHRKRLAGDLAISEVALRLRVHRLRGRLADCLGECLEGETKSRRNDSRE